MSKSLLEARLDSLEEAFNIFLKNLKGLHTMWHEIKNAKTAKQPLEDVVNVTLALARKGIVVEKDYLMNAIKASDGGK